MVQFFCRCYLLRRPSATPFTILSTIRHVRPCAQAGELSPSPKFHTRVRNLAKLTDSPLAGSIVVAVIMNTTWIPLTKAPRSTASERRRRQHRDRDRITALVLFAFDGCGGKRVNGKNKINQTCGRSVRPFPAVIFSANQG